MTADNRRPSTEDLVAQRLDDAGQAGEQSASIRDELVGHLGVLTAGGTSGGAVHEGQDAVEELGQGADELVPCAENGREVDWKQRH